MGLFTNKKKLCPICGNPTPRLFPREFDDQPICKECENKIDLPGEILDNMTLDGFRQYLVAYEENEVLRSIFHETYRYGGGLFSSDALFLDEENGLIRLKTTPKGWAIEKQYLKSFRIFEDDNLLFESGEGTLNSYPSEIPARAEALRPAVSTFHVEKQAYERREQLERARNMNETDEQRRGDSDRVSHGTDDLQRCSRSGGRRGRDPAFQRPDGSGHYHRRRIYGQEAAAPWHIRRKV